MISFITGKLLKTCISKDSYVDILTNSGIGFRVNIPNSYICPSLGEEYSLYTYLHVREDNLALYGFEKEDEKDFFGQLINISGVGPKIALAILSTFSRVDLEAVIAEGDARALGKVPGLGLKKAQKIILELRGKVDFNLKEESSESILKELKEALKALGFSGDSLKERVSIAEEIYKNDKEIGIEELIKETLRQND